MNRPASDLGPATSQPSLEDVQQRSRPQVLLQPTSPNCKNFHQELDLLSDADVAAGQSIRTKACPELHS